MVSKDEFDDSNVQYIVLQYSVNSFCTYMDRVKKQNHVQNQNRFRYKEFSRKTPQYHTIYYDCNTTG